jgi:ADP-heptose:LPS heptosyltransferase
LKVFNCRHPAREPEEVTVKDCRACPWKPKESSAEKVVLRCGNDRFVLCPGDALVMSAAIYSLHQAHPGRFRTAVETSADGLFDYLPYVWKAAPGDLEGVRKVNVEYPAVNQSNQRGIHFMSAYCEGLSQALGVPVPLATNRPQIHVSTREREWMSAVQEITGRPTQFWVVNAGHKTDYTAKWWGTENYQRVVDLLRGKVQFAQIGSLEHTHPPLRGVIDLRGKTDDHRQLVRLCWHASGGLGGVTFLQHLCAALEKPYVCLLGGREPNLWTSYPLQQTFHTLGALPCCRTSACWRSRTVALKDGSEQDNSLCENPFFGPDTIPACMARIEPEEVARAILRIHP